MVLKSETRKFHQIREDTMTTTTHAIYQKQVSKDIDPSKLTSQLLILIHLLINSTINFMLIG